MRTILSSYTLAVALAALAYGADQTTPQKKKAPAKSTVSARKAPPKAPSKNLSAHKTARKAPGHKPGATGKWCPLRSDIRKSRMRW